MKYEQFTRLLGIAALSLTFSLGAYGALIDQDPSVTFSNTTNSPTNYNGAVPGPEAAFTGIQLLATHSGTSPAQFPGGIAGNWATAVGIDLGCQAATGLACLDFVYQFDPTATDLQKFDAVSFLTTLLQPIGVGYLSSLTGYVGSPAANVFTGVASPFLAPATTGCGNPVGTNCAPTSANWTGATVHWDFSAADQVNTGQNSPILVIRTRATTYTDGFANATDGLSTPNFAAFQPAPEPGQISLLLGGLFAVGLFVARRYRVVQN